MPTSPHPYRAERRKSTGGWLATYRLGMVFGLYASASAATSRTGRSAIGQGLTVTISSAGSYFDIVISGGQIPVDFVSGE